jgi:hypothetical protein
MSLCEPGLEMAAAAAADPMEKEEEEEVNCRAGEEVKLAGRPDEGRVPPARPANVMRMGYNLVIKMHQRGAAQF